MDLDLAGVTNGFTAPNNVDGAITSILSILGDHPRLTWMIVM